MRVPPPCGIRDRALVGPEGEKRHPACTLPAGHGLHEELQDDNTYAQWRGGMPSERVEQLEAIVRALAKDGPFTNDYSDCQTCAATITLDLDDPKSHDPTCLWRRARELTGKPTDG
jgi:hypothetical protein